MMNRYYGQSCRFSGRSGRDPQNRDFAPYRRPAAGRGCPSAFPYGSQAPVRGGCGCGLGQDRSRDNGQMRDHDRDRVGECPGVRPATRNDGCGCGLGQDRSRDNGQMRDHDRDRVGECPGVRPATRNDGCGRRENRCGTPACKKLMEQMRAVDFALYEVILYLDVYPRSCDALETYHKLKAQQEALRREYEASCGPITAFGNQSGASWDWIDPPFPWEYGAE